MVFLSDAYCCFCFVLCNAEYAALSLNDYILMNFHVFQFLLLSLQSQKIDGI